MSQMTFSDYEYSCRKKKTKREEFLDVMEDIIQWDEWVEFVRPYYPSGKRGRPTKGIEKTHIEDIIKLCEKNIGNKYLTPNKNIKVFLI